MVMAQGARLLVLGVLIGIVAAVAASRVLGSLLFGVEATDPVTFVAMSVAMFAIGTLATYLPARRASSVDPMESLRSE